MKSKEFIQEVKDIIRKVFSIDIKEEVESILEELIENYLLIAQPLVSSTQNIQQNIQIRRIFKGKNRKNENVLLIYLEEAHGIILNLDRPDKSQIGTLPSIKF